MREWKTTPHSPHTSHYARPTLRGGPMPAVSPPPTVTNYSACLFQRARPHIMLDPLCSPHPDARGVRNAPPRRAALQPSGHHGHPHRALGPARLRVLPTWRAQGLGVPLRPALAARAPRLLARCPPTQASTRRLAANIAAGRRSRGARGGADATRAVCSDAPSHFASEVRTGRAFNGELVLGC